MGRRSRQRASAPPRARTPAPPPAPSPVATAARRSRRDAAPQAPWGSFPLVELCALAAIVLGVWGFAAHNGVLLTGAAFLGSVAGLEVAIREHLGGYRSHTLVLAGLCAVVTLTVLAFAHAARTTMLAGAAAVLIAAFVGLRQLFKRRSGGVGMRVR
ncbi:MAG TPA: hypothetical protein VFS37_03285 [Conexibacter sp.]|nr:hypothetical protein [Conexibacter sp.]